MKNLLPIRKVVVAALTAGGVYVLRKVAHVDVASSTVEDAVNVFLPVVAGWAVKDPRVVRLEQEVEKLGLLTKLRLLNEVLAEAAAPAPAPVPDSEAPAPPAPAA